MSKFLLVFSSIFSFVVLSNAQAFKMPEAEEYFSEWIVDYRSIVAGEGPLTTTPRPAPSTTHTFTSDPENNVGFISFRVANTAYTFTEAMECFKKEAFP